MPEKVLKKLNESILPQWKVCFFASVIVGLFAHLYKITGWIPNWDSLVFRYDPQNMIGLGRWFLPVACCFSSFYDLPFLNGITAILFHALSAVCICKILNVQKNITAALIGALIVCFPTVTSVMMYNYVADGYSIAFFLSVIAAMFMASEKPRYILSAIIIAFCVGIYQAYITVTIMLVLLKLMDELVYDNASFRTILKKGVFMLLSGLLGMALYSITLKLLLGIFSAKLLDYQGINTSVALSEIDIFASLYTVKETFIKCFFDLSEGINLYIILNFLVLVITLVYHLKHIVVNKFYKKIVNLITVVILSGVLIIGAGVLAFINAGIDYHNLMMMGYSVFYLFFLIVYERGTDSNEMHICIRRWIVLVISVIMIANLVVISNVSYHKAQMAYEKSYGVLIRITDRIEQTPGAEDCNRILVLGALEDSRAYSVNLTPNITGITDGYIIRADDESVGQSVFCSAISDYCGKDYDFVSGDEKKLISQTDTVKAMNVWPRENCVAVINDIIVVKLGTEGEN